MPKSDFDQYAVAGFVVAPVLSALFLLLAVGYQYLLHADVALQSCFRPLTGVVVVGPAVFFEAVTWWYFANVKTSHDHHDSDNCECCPGPCGCLHFSNASRNSRRDVTWRTVYITLMALPNLQKAIGIGIYATLRMLASTEAMAWPSNGHARESYEVKTADRGLFSPRCSLPSHTRLRPL